MGLGRGMVAISTGLYLLLKQVFLIVRNFFSRFFNYAINLCLFFLISRKKLVMSEIFNNLPSLIDILIYLFIIKKKVFLQNFN